MIKYKANGIVLGNCWGGGIGGYPAKKFIADSKKNLDKRINAGIADGSIDSGMGFESIIGAMMCVETVDERTIDGKLFIAVDEVIQSYGDLSEEQEEFLLECAVC